MENWLDSYFKRYKKSLFKIKVYDELITFKNIASRIKKSGNKIILAGNGASCSIASHAATDFTKQVKIRSMCVSDSSLITAYVNDYGYESWVSEAIKSYYSEGDLVVLISSSGTSKNIVSAAKTAKNLGLNLVTFSGFSAQNHLKKFGDVNFWVDSKAYNIIENTHSIWITTVVDMLLGKAEYPVK